MRRRPTRSKGEFSQDVKAVVFARARGECEAMTPLCRGTGEHYHHRRLRSQGGKGTVENCLLVCHWCHVFIHDHPEQSYASGWMIHGRDS